MSAIFVSGKGHGQGSGYNARQQAYVLGDPGLVPVRWEAGAGEGIPGRNTGSWNIRG